MHHKILKAVKLLGLFPAISLLPMPAAYKLATILKPMNGKDLKNYICGMESGIRLVLDERSPAVGDVHQCIKNNLNMLSMEIMDAFIVPRLTPKSIGRLCTISGIEQIRLALKQKRGLIIATAHFGRLLMIPFTLGILGVKVRSLSQDISKKNPYIDWVDRAYLQNKVKKLYKTSKIRGITLGEDLREIYKALRKNQILFILMDAYPPGITRLQARPFLGGSLRLPTGIQRISQRTKAPLVYAAVKPDRNWRVKVKIDPIPGYGPEAFEEAVRKLEADIAKQPCQWWQWGYMNTMWTPES